MSALICMSAAACQTALAQNVFEKLIMPGDLIAGHAKLEEDCGNCHQPFSKTTQDQLCLDCHDKVAADIQSKSGFHGRRNEVSADDCNHCHTDHIGRDGDIVRFDPEAFNHAFSDFQLKGAHKTALCEGCHPAGKKYRTAAHKCLDCHKADEPHKGRLGTACEDCHNEVAWADTPPFDHSKTKFPLVGKHRKVACKTCHVGEYYKGIPTACIDCHRAQDVHAGRFGVKCDSCHSSKDWETVAFDHAKDTKFALVGKHQRVGCYDCHKSGNAYEEELSKACFSCHRKDDAHKGKLGKSCSKCHDPSGWRTNVQFNHDITRFPLIGLHASTPCGECHLTASFSDAATECIACHSIDDYHDGRLGKVCDTCHNPNSWQLWTFDHNTQTDYPLTGAHDGLDCHACHTETNVSKISLTDECYDCHRADDVHRRRFGKACGRCHSTDSFSTPFANQ